MRIIGNDPSIPRKTQVVASGTLSTGNPVIVLADGSVQVVEQNTVTQSATTPVVYEQGNTSSHAACYDTTNNKVVVAYDDEDNSNYGTAIVGTVSNGAITFGTAVVFESASVDYVACDFDASAGKVVIAYKDNGNSNRCTAVVGTVSGTSISFGTPVVVQTETSYYMNVVYDSANSKTVVFWQTSSATRAKVGTVSGTTISFGSVVSAKTESNPSFLTTCYDSTNSQILLSWRDGSADGRATRGTVSGTSISFSGEGEWEAGSVASDQGIAYDPVNQKAVIFYRNSGNSNYGTAIVVTNTGSGSLTFGTKVVFLSAIANNIRAAYDSTSGKIVVAYRDGGNSSYGTFASATVSGTSVSFDSPYVFESAVALNFGMTDVTDEGVVFIGYKDNGNTGKGTATLVTAGYTDKNLTSENFVGFAKSDVIDGDGVVVNTQGAIDEGQSSLTAGQAYYVQNDGTLSTTADDPSVFAGTAVSATKLIVKG